ncbi:hypothetical protein JOC77_002976 [Peribacillus deserti]|uniref:Type I restriction modification DNA specificity domain-containing protein n=1 Tax=Peribacillus deserti TaxID=673318 RepID=A0ABS2QMQ5_9BACI|nr:restriction endonuclease subunit S [Peribacillus deserti]MBM7693536.1 hypothetical protein [Peribacillus deserti]
MVKLNDYFDVKYGVNLELNKLEIDPNGINFVSRTEKNNGVSAKVKRLPHIRPIPGGTITVAAGGTVMSTYLQPSEFYSGRDLYYLVPKIDLTTEEKLFYCLSLRKNKFKYSYGRQANTTLSTLEIPAKEDIPEWVYHNNVTNMLTDMLADLVTAEEDDIDEKPPLSVLDEEYVQVEQLFHVYNGIASSSVKRYESKENSNFIPYIRPSKNQSTSIDAFVDKAEISDKYIFPKGTLYVSTDGQGSHTYSYVSTFEFVPNSNVAVLVPKYKMDLVDKLFYAYCITRNRYKYSYGRKPKGHRLKELLIPSKVSNDYKKYSMNVLIDSWKEKLNIK